MCVAEPSSALLQVDVSVSLSRLGYVLTTQGDLTGARVTVTRLTDRDNEFGEARTAIAALRLAEGNGRAAIEALAPVLDGTAPVVRAGTVIQALLLDAVARDQLGDRVAAERDIERALDVAEPDSLVFPFVVVPAHALLERHPRHRTAHAALLADLLSVLGGSSLPARRTALRQCRRARRRTWKKTGSTGRHTWKNTSSTTVRTSMSRWMGPNPGMSSGRRRYKLFETPLP